MKANNNRYAAPSEHQEDDQYSGERHEPRDYRGASSVARAGRFDDQYSGERHEPRDYRGASSVARDRSYNSRGYIREEQFFKRPSEKTEEIIGEIERYFKGNFKSAEEFKEFYIKMDLEVITELGSRGLSMSLYLFASGKNLEYRKNFADSVFLANWLEVAKSQINTLDMVPLALAQIIVALSQLGDFTFIEDWITKVLPILGSFTPRDLSTSMGALAKLNCDPGRQFIEKFIKVAKLNAFTSKDLVGSITSMAKFHYKAGDTLIQSWLKDARNELFKLDKKIYNNIYSQETKKALGPIKYPNDYSSINYDEVYKQLSKKILEELESVDFSKSLEIFVSKCNVKSPFINIFIEVLESKIDAINIKPMDLSKIFSALAKLNKDIDYNPNFIKCLLNKASSILDEFIPIDLSRIMGALAKLNYNPGEAFITELMKSVRLNEFNIMDLVTIIHSLAKFNFDPGIDFIQNWIKCTSDVLSKMEPRDLSSSIHDLSKFIKPGTYGEDEFLKSWAKIVYPKLAAFNPQDLSLSLSGLAKLDFYPGDKFIQKLTEVAYPKLDDFVPSNLVNTIWAIAKFARILDLDSKFINAWIQKTQPILRNFNSEELANSLWSITILTHRDPNHSFINDWIKAYEESTIVEINVLWSLSHVYILNYRKGGCEYIYDYIKAKFDVIVGQISSGSFVEKETKKQLLQVYYALKQEDQDPQPIMENFSKEILEGNSFTSSLFQRSVESEIYQIYPALKPEYFIKEVVSSVDIYIEEENLVIEIDGPFHFDKSGEYEIYSVYKKAILEKYGYKVLRLKYTDLDISLDLKSYLIDKIKEFLGRSSSAADHSEIQLSSSKAALEFIRSEFSSKEALKIIRSEFNSKTLTKKEVAEDYFKNIKPLDLDYKYLVSYVDLISKLKFELENGETYIRNWKEVMVTHSSEFLEKDLIRIEDAWDKIRIKYRSFKDIDLDLQIDRDPHPGDGFGAGGGPTPKANKRPAPDPLKESNAKKGAVLLCIDASIHDPNYNKVFGEVAHNIITFTREKVNAASSIMMLLSGSSKKLYFAIQDKTRESGFSFDCFSNYKTALMMQGADSGVDLLRAGYVPNNTNIYQALLSAYSLFGVIKMSPGTLLTASFLDGAYKGSLGDYQEAAIKFVTTVIFTGAPVILSSVGLSSLEPVVGDILLASRIDHFINNVDSLAKYYGTPSGERESVAAWAKWNTFFNNVQEDLAENFFGALVGTWLGPIDISFG